MSHRLLSFLTILIFLSVDPAQAAPRQLPGKSPLLHPIVLVHGATTKGSELKIGFFSLGEYFRNIPFFYALTGTPVFTAHLSTDGTIGERAAVLKNYLETETRGKMVNIVAHSLGGLDARYAVSVLGCRQIASITTIGTPHQGTPLANWAVRQMKNGSPWYWFFRLLGYDMRQRRFLNEITTEFMRTVFNEKVRNVGDVRYFSVATSASFQTDTMSYFLYFPNKWLQGENHPLAANGHDGMVPKDSQVWGQLIDTQILDHLGQMNHHEFRSMGSGAEGTSYNVYSMIYDNLFKNGL